MKNVCLYKVSFLPLIRISDPRIPGGVFRRSSIYSNGTIEKDNWLADDTAVIVVASQNLDLNKCM